MIGSGLWEEMGEEGRRRERGGDGLEVEECSPGKMKHLSVCDCMP